MLAQRIAETLQGNGVQTWWAEWEIGAGDSLRQKIDAGLSDCTHFIVLLTPRSIVKPWVNQEMDAGLVLKIQARCRFITLRHMLPAEALPRSYLAYCRRKSMRLPLIYASSSMTFTV